MDHDCSIMPLESQTIAEIERFGMKGAAVEPLLPDTIHVQENFLSKSKPRPLVSSARETPVTGDRIYAFESDYGTPSRHQSFEQALEYPTEPVCRCVQNDSHWRIIKGHSSSSFLHL
jgi:hypothetical protein